MAARHIHLRVDVYDDMQRLHWYTRWATMSRDSQQIDVKASTKGYLALGESRMFFFYNFAYKNLRQYWTVEWWPEALLLLMQTSKKSKNQLPVLCSTATPH